MEHLHFRVPFEEPTPTAAELMRRAWPEGTEAQHRQLFDDGAVHIDERITKNPERGADPGLFVDVQPLRNDTDAATVVDGDGVTWPEFKDCSASAG